MSEWQSIYYSGKTMTLDDFSEVFVGDDDVATKIDRIYITKAGGRDEFIVFAYKGRELVNIVPEGKIVKDIVFCRGYIGMSEEIIYRIEIENEAENYYKACYIISPEGITYYDYEMAEDRAWERARREREQSK